VISGPVTDQILVGGVAHETNTFASPTSRDDFRANREYHGTAIPNEFEETNTEFGGVIQRVEGADVDVRWTVAASATPGGTVTAEAYEYYAAQLLNAARESVDDLDGVLLVLHGAMVAEGVDDAEGDLAGRMRDIVGDLPVVVSLDSHGNVSDALVNAADALVAYETYPHVDQRATGRRATDLLLATVRGRVDPVVRVEYPPVLAFGPGQNTRDGPMTAVMDRARAIEDRDGILKANVLPGFHAADVPCMGASIPVVADGNADDATAAARELAELYWDRREAFVDEFPSPPEAVAEAADLAAADDNGTIVVADLGDNPGGGGAGDGTAILREILKQGVTNAGVAVVADPEVVATCVAAGAGERVTVNLGAKTDDHHGETIRSLEAYVKSVTDGRFENRGPMATGDLKDLGRAVRLQCGTDGTIEVIVAEERCQPYDREVWRHVGIQPERLDVVVVKSMNHFRADYEPIASHVLVADSPGLANELPSPGPLHRVRRPVFPLDEMDDDDYPDW
jgi:microcystin degradation protein MlrC